MVCEEPLPARNQVVKAIAATQLLFTCKRPHLLDNVRLVQALLACALVQVLRKLLERHDPSCPAGVNCSIEGGAIHVLAAAQHDLQHVSRLAHFAQAAIHAHQAVERGGIRLAHAAQPVKQLLGTGCLTTCSPHTDCCMRVRDSCWES